LSKGKGRQPGAISQQWRSILVEVADRFPAGASDDGITTIARSFGLDNTRPKDVRDRMNAYQAHGYVESTPSGWRVTGTAVEKFKGKNGTADPVVESAA
jgi:hypothetical protein